MWWSVLVYPVWFVIVLLLNLWTDKELDIIEMAMYGDVIRPGKQCRCRIVAEVLGQVKPTNHMAACELPDKGAS